MHSADITISGGFTAEGVAEDGGGAEKIISDSRLEWASKTQMPLKGVQGPKGHLRTRLCTEEGIVCTPCGYLAGGPHFQKCNSYSR